MTLRNATGAIVFLFSIPSFAETINIDALNANAVDAGVVRAQIYEGPPSASTLMRSHLAGDSSGNDFAFFTENYRSAGTTFIWANQYNPLMTLEWNGNAWLAGNLTIYGGITNTYSGSAFGVSADGDYFAVAARLPFGYDGAHGMLTAINTHEMRGGLLMELSRGVPGNPMSSKMFTVDWAGGATSAHAGWQTTTLPHCGGGETLNLDGGPIGILDGGFGNVGLGSTLFVVDTGRHRECFCDPDRGDGGPVGTLGDGWVKVKDETPCSE